MKSLDQLYDETIRDLAFYLQSGNALLAEIYNGRLDMIFKAQFEIGEAILRAGVSK